MLKGWGLKLWGLVTLVGLVLYGFLKAVALGGIKEDAEDAKDVIREAKRRQQIEEDNSDLSYDEYIERLRRNGWLDDPK